MKKPTKSLSQRIRHRIGRCYSCGGTGERISNIPHLGMVSCKECYDWRIVLREVLAMERKIRTLGAARKDGGRNEK